MTLPLLPLLTGGSLILNKLFQHRPDYNLPPSPKFFDKDFQDVLSAYNQYNQTRYGKGAYDLREILSNQGLLGNQGAFTDALTKRSIAEGQDQAAGNLNLFQQEFNNKRNFQTHEYNANLDRNKVLYEGDVGARQNELGLLSKLGAVGGYMLANRQPQAAPALGGAQGNQPYNPNDPLYGTGLGLEDQHRSFGRKLLSTLFGF